MMFTPKDILERVKQRPFMPIRIVTSAGQSFDVLHPDMIWVGTRDIHIGTPNTEYPEVYDAVTRIALMHINTITDVPAATKPPAGSNGAIDKA